MHNLLQCLTLRLFLDSVGSSAVANIATWKKLNKTVFVSSITLLLKRLLEINVKFRWNLNFSIGFILLKYSVALRVPILRFSLQRLCAPPSICWIHNLRLFVSSYCLFYTTRFGLNGHHEVYETVEENRRFAVTLLYFAVFYE